MSATASEFELRPVGGVRVRNRQGRTVFWFKGKDPSDGSMSFALCTFRPELADNPKMERNVRRVFRVMLAMARKGHFPIFDAQDLDCEMREFLGDVGATALKGQRREEEITLHVKELSTGRRLPLTIAMKPPEAHRQEASLWT
jgi:hypothetical protein